MPDCSIQRVTDLSAWECVGDSLTATWMNNFDFLDASTCNLEFSASLWNSTRTTVMDLSARWETLRTTVIDTSAGYNNTFTHVNTTSGQWTGPITLIYPCAFVDVEGRSDTIFNFLTNNFPASSYSPDIEFMIYWPEWNIADDYTPGLEVFTEGCTKDICDTASSDVYVDGIVRFTYKNISNTWVQQ